MLRSVNQYDQQKPHQYIFLFLTVLIVDRCFVAWKRGLPRKFAHVLCRHIKLAFLFLFCFNPFCVLVFQECLSFFLVFFSFSLSLSLSLSSPPPPLNKTVKERSRQSFRPMCYNLFIRVPCMFPVCSLCVPCMFPVCSLCVPCMFPVCSGPRGCVQAYTDIISIMHALYPSGHQRL